MQVMVKKEEMWTIVVPFTLMFLMEGVTIALTIAASKAMQAGMNQFVFVAYSNAVSSIILIPYCIIFHKQRMREIFNFKLLGRFFFLGLIGTTIAQNLAFTGLRYSSPIVVCGMGLLLPCFQFFLALIQGKTTLNMRRLSTIIRLLAIIISFTGGFMVMFYQGPSIIPSSSLSSTHSILLPPPLRPLHPFLSTLTTTQTWIFGTSLLALASFCLALWGTLQMETFNVFPDIMVIVTCNIAFGTVQTAVVDLLAEEDLTAWKLGFNMELYVIVLTAICGTFLRSRVQAWCTKLKGPMYVPMFKPFGIFWACLITLSLFGSSLHYGSVAGCCISAIGYYAMMWAVTTEVDEITKSTDEEDDEETDEIKAPLLQRQVDQEDEQADNTNHV